MNEIFRNVLKTCIIKIYVTYIDKKSKIQVMRIINIYSE